MPGASSSGHWKITIVCAICRPSGSTLKARKTVLKSSFRIASLIFSLSREPARLSFS